MIEAVGQNYLQSYFNTIKKNLSINGNAGIQAITIDDSLFDRYKNKQDFIQKYIFPGGFLLLFFVFLIILFFKKFIAEKSKIPENL